MLSMYKTYLFGLWIFFCGVVIVSGEEPVRVRSCFRYTWLGPNYTNESVFMNATCQDATRLATGVPCQQPLVVSYDGSWPDVNYIWQNHRENATCRLQDTDVCAIYTYFFNGRAENSTHMCTRVIDSEGAIITRGCYEQTVGARTTRVCFCQSFPGAMPCNRANTLNLAFTNLIIVLFLFAFMSENFLHLKIYDT